MSASRDVLAPFSPPEPGQMLGRFEIVQTIGVGGYATVYEARETTSSMRVALKVVRLEYHDDEIAAKRAVLEIKCIRELDHNNIVSFIGGGVMKPRGLVWIAMEMVPGRSLHQLMSIQGPMGVTLTLKIAKDICSALCAVHKAGIVHRDIKPANIMVTPHDVAKILDFGIARRGDRSLGTTNIIGTPLYMAPDYVRRGVQKTDPRHDLYALCLIAWECIAGRHPLIEKEDDGHLSYGAIAHRVVTKKIPPLLREVPGCPERVSACFQQGLQKNIKAGWQTAEALYEELSACFREVRRLNERPDPHLDAMMDALATGPQAEPAASELALAPTAPDVSFAMLGVTQPEAPTALRAQTGTLLGHGPMASPESKASPRVTRTGTEVMGQGIPAEVLAHPRAQAHAGRAVTPCLDTGQLMWQAMQTIDGHEDHPALPEVPLVRRQSREMASSHVRPSTKMARSRSSEASLPRQTSAKITWRQMALLSAIFVLVPVSSALFYLARQVRGTWIIAHFILLTAPLLWAHAVRRGIVTSVQTILIASGVLAAEVAALVWWMA